MEDNNANKEILENSSNEENVLNEIKNNDISYENVENTSNEDASMEDVSNVTESFKDNSMLLERYQFYKSQIGNDSRAVVSVVNKKTVTMFIVFMMLCIVIFVSCMVIDFRNPEQYELSAIGDSSALDTYKEDVNNNSTSFDSSTNNGILIEQYQTPERDDSTYMNDDGTYTVSGVAKYASDSIIAIYVSTDGLNLNGMGSGIVFSDEGYVLTNAHVIEDANYIIGILQDETQINLSFVGMNSELDIAVLQSDNKDIPVATMGDSDSVILGEDVVAIGNPAGLTGTVTKGIVSSINRSYITSDDVERTYIQTDTAISPGNSGGALLNMYGQVIGITTLKISEDQTYEGLGFAICINDALECAEELIENRFKIGITFNLQNNEIEIKEIDSSCSIANTQLKKGDIITQINGQDVTDYSTVMSALEGSKPGDSVTAKVQRRSNDGLTNEFYIEFQLMPYNY
ncbi:MAG: trypsin-like peptidase domain-containing protein [Ruminococcus sp.]|nr:trypsin-like peptidase domain-containing protein [Ruminococcus sp.]